jgi:hypothetical protein
MTRVHHGRPQHAAHRSAILEQPRAALRKKKPYKIVLEAVTQEKKKLHSIVGGLFVVRALKLTSTQLTYASNAPDGFGFVPAGNPEFTEWCKEQCRQRNLDVHIVSVRAIHPPQCDSQLTLTTRQNPRTRCTPTPRSCRTTSIASDITFPWRS